MAISSYGTTLKWGASAEAVAKVVDIKDFADLIGDPNNLETTDLSKRAQTFIAGILQSNTISFTCNYTKEDFNACKQDENKPLHYEITFQDGSGFKWQGQHTLGFSGKGVDEVLEFTINILPSSEITFDLGA